MLHNPHVMQKAQAELDSVVGHDRMPEHSDYDNLPYIRALINETLPFASPYIVPGTPWLYKPLPGVAGETAVTPAWRDAIWHLSVRWEFMFDDTLEEREHGYKTLMEKVQKFRDLSPGSGAYFVSTM